MHFKVLNMFVFCFDENLCGLCTSSGVRRPERDAETLINRVPKLRIGGALPHLPYVVFRTLYSYHFTSPALVFVLMYVCVRGMCRQYCTNGKKIREVK
jgi:hypothetical protein